MRLGHRNPAAATEQRRGNLFYLPRKIVYPSLGRLVSRSLVVVARLVSLVFVAWVVYALVAGSDFGGLDVVTSAAVALTLREWWASRHRSDPHRYDHHHPNPRGSRCHG